MKVSNGHSRFFDIWQSFKALPTWVLVWIGVFLGPINVASLGFLSQPWGALIAALAVGGMLFSMGALIAYRGFSKMVSGGHVFLWTPLVLFLIFARPDATGLYSTYLTVLVCANAFSLIFDINDLRL